MNDRFILIDRVEQASFVNPLTYGVYDASVIVSGDAEKRGDGQAEAMPERQAASNDHTDCQSGRGGQNR